MVRHCFLIPLCFVALAGWAQLPPVEQKLIGVWEWTTIDAVGRIRIRPNHRYDLWFLDSKRDEHNPDPRYVIHGGWTITSKDLRYINDPGQLRGELKSEEHRIPLSDFDSHMKRIE